MTQLDSGTAIAEPPRGLSGRRNKPTNLRPELSQHLAQRLQAFSDGFRHNIALLGPPGSGKTFQLQRLLDTAPAAVSVIYCPLYHESCRTFLTRLLCAILQSGLSSRPHGRAGSRVAHDTAQTPSLESLLQHADTALPRTAAAIRQIESLLARRAFGEAFTRSLDTIPVLIEETGRPCVLILDEFLFLDELGLSHAFHELGKRVMTWPSTLFILSSSSVHRARAILRERLQLLFGQFELLLVDALDPRTAEDWVKQELRGIRRANVITPFLIHWLGTYPWYLTVFLARLKELATLGHRFDLPEHLFLQTAWDVVGRRQGPLHQWCVSQTDSLAHNRLGTRALDSLIQIASGARTATEIGNRIGRGGLSSALQLLVEHDLAQRNGMCWLITDPVIRCWLSTVLQAQRADVQLDESNARHRFDTYLRLLWVRWEQMHQLSFSEQIVKLFERFNDETVSLDSKTGRLPKFDTITTHPLPAAEAETYLVADDSGGKRWCATVKEQLVGEADIASFDQFCRGQTPKPSRKVVIARTGLEQHARLLAKTANMWVWEPDDLHVLHGLYSPQL